MRLLQARGLAVGAGLVLALVSIACGTSTPASTAPTQASPSTAGSPSIAASATATAAARSPSPSPSPMCSAGADEAAVRVPSTANLFGAGLESPPQPGGGGAGLPPVLVELPSGGPVVVTLPCVEGLTNCCEGSPDTGPAGDPGQSTNVESAGGIAGMVLEGRAMFLAGVFIANEPPKGPAPERLDFTGRLEDERIEPGLYQTFYVGDGVDRSIVAPDGATRLYLGFVDAFFFIGKPGWYGNNRGFLDATVRLTIG